MLMPSFNRAKLIQEFTNLPGKAVNLTGRTMMMASIKIWLKTGALVMSVYFTRADNDDSLTLKVRPTAAVPLFVVA